MFYHKLGLYFNDLYFTLYSGFRISTGSRSRKIGAITAAWLQSFLRKDCKRPHFLNRAANKNSRQLVATLQNLYPALYMALCTDNLSYMWLA